MKFSVFLYRVDNAAKREKACEEEETEIKNAKRIPVRSWSDTITQLFWEPQAYTLSERRVTRTIKVCSNNLESVEVDFNFSSTSDKARNASSI